jgi:hypothetical protein
LKTSITFLNMRRMHITRWLAQGSFLLTLVLGVVSAREVAGAEETSATPPAKTAKVAGLKGRAQLSRDSGTTFVPLLIGTEVRIGDVVRTAVASALDLDLGVGPTVRLTESTLVALDKVTESGTNNGPEIELSLRAGEVLGRLKEGMVSRFEIKTPVGIAQILHGQFRVQSRGYVVVLQGKTLFAHVPPGGQPAAHTLNAPPACYFTPLAGVRPAPRELSREVSNQLKAKLEK